MKTRGHYTLFLLLLLTAFLADEARPQSQAEEMVKRGQYIFAIAGGCACHTEPEDTLHAGGREFPVPLGTIYSTNITQDKETGLGNWSDQEIYDSIVKGLRPNGEILLPVMPYEAYSGMAETDLKALDYLCHETLNIIHVGLRSFENQVSDLIPAPILDAGFLVRSNIGDLLAKGSRCRTGQIEIPVWHPQTVSWGVAVTTQGHMIREIASSFNTAFWGCGWACEKASKKL